HDRVSATGTSLAPLPRLHPTSGLPDFGTNSRPKSDKSDFGWRLGGGVACSGRRLPPPSSPQATVPEARLPAHSPIGKLFWKNTGDLQEKMRANYRTRPCASLRKAAGARTGKNNEKNNGKNNAQSNRNSRTSGRVHACGRTKFQAR